MPLSWSALHAQLLSCSTHPAFERDYRSYHVDDPDTLPMRDVAGLLSFLTTPSGDPEAKNRALRALAVRATGDEPRADTATVLLLLALWPGLDAVRHRLRRVWCGPLDDLGAELVSRLTLAIRSLDLGRVSRVAATLLRNLERDLRRELIRTASERPRDRPVEDILETAAELGDDHQSKLQGRDCPDAMRARLHDVVGGDAHLVLLVVVGGLSQREAAARLGLSHEAARKRFQRAMSRLRATTAGCPNPPV